LNTESVVLTARERFDLALANCAVTRANFRTASQAMQAAQDELAAAGEALAAEARARLAEANEAAPRPRGTAVIATMARSLNLNEDKLREDMIEAGVDGNSHSAVTDFARHYAARSACDVPGCTIKHARD
jgi:hypothetical protein